MKQNRGGEGEEGGIERGMKRDKGVFVPGLFSTVRLTSCNLHDLTSCHWHVPDGMCWSPPPTTYTQACMYAYAHTHVFIHTHAHTRAHLRTHISHIRTFICQVWQSWSPYLDHLVLLTILLRVIWKTQLFLDHQSYSIPVQAHVALEQWVKSTSCLESEKRVSLDVP